MPDAKPEPREHLKKAAEEIAKYEAETCCAVNRDAVEPVRKELELHYRADALAEAVAMKQVEREKGIRSVVQQGEAVAQKVGASVPEPRPRKGFLPVRPGTVVRQTMATLRESVRSVPRPGRIIRGDVEEEERR